MKILVAHPGTQHSAHLARALSNRGALLRYCTSLALGKDSLLAQLLPSGLAQRRAVSLNARLIHNQPLLEWAEALVRIGARAQEILRLRNQIFQRSIPASLLRKADALIAFDTSSLVLAQRSKRYGKKLFFEATTPHPAAKAQIMVALDDAYPLWTQSNGLSDGTLEDQEAAEAFRVLVPSRQVMDSYLSRGVPQEKITINPYGVYPEQFPLRKFERNKKLRFLFLGSLTANKGVPLLLDAWREVNTDKAELIVAGYGTIPKGVTLPPGVIVRGRIEKSDRVALMHSCDVFVFPSFYEGIAIVQIEAMCCGLPLIGTTTSGAPGIVEEGRQGFVVESGSREALAEKMNIFVNYPDKIEPMGREAHIRASTLTWQSYADRWLSLMESTISSES